MRRQIRGVACSFCRDYKKGTRLPIQSAKISAIETRNASYKSVVDRVAFNFPQRLWVGAQGGFSGLIHGHPTRNTATISSKWMGHTGCITKQGTCKNALRIKRGRF